jgi:uncharacterized protein YndB with AHSA1/START domain
MNRIDKERWMPERTVTHSTFVVERTYDVPPARVFNAFSDPVIKARWFVGPDEWSSSNYKLDFRIGGRETTSGGPPGGPIHRFDGRYQDIVPNERIIFTYDMHLDETRISVSLATVELKPIGAGTRLTFTEQGAFLDGYDIPDERERGTIVILEQLAKELESASESA